MLCPFCKTEINDNYKSCVSCGNSLNTTLNTSPNHVALFLRYLVGVLFIVGGFLPYLLLGDLYEYYTYFESFGYLGDRALAAASIFSKFSSFLSPFFYFSSSVLAIYTGLLIIKNSDTTVILLTCSLAHAVSIIYSGVINLLIFFFPRSVLSAYTSDPSVIDAGEEIIQSEPDLLYYYQDDAIRRLIISVALILFAFLLIFIKKRYMNHTAQKSIEVSSIGNILMILSLSLIAVISPITNSLKSHYGIAVNYASSVAKSVYDLNISLIVIFLFIAIIGVSVIFTRVKRWIIMIPVVGIIVILGFIAFLFSNLFIQDFTADPVIFDITSIIFRGLIISSVVTLTAMFCWFSSASKNLIPKWLQIALPLSLPLIYICAEVPLHSTPGISFGSISVSLITIILSLFVRTKANKIQNPKSK